MERRDTPPTLMDGYIRELGEPKVRGKLRSSTDRRRDAGGVRRLGVHGSAYMDKKRKRRLEEQGVFRGITGRRVRGQKELTAEQKAHNKLCASFRAYVEHPFAWIKKAGGFVRARYRGLRRNALDFGLAAMACNLERSPSLPAAGG